MPDDDLTTDLTRDELNDIAREAGVPDPDSLPNKEAVIEAVEEVRARPNPALVPEPEPEPDPVEVAAAMPDPEPEPDERAYQVTGPHIVLEHKPGEKFAARIPAEQEALLIESGHIKRLNQED